MPPVEPKRDVRIMPVLSAYARATSRYPSRLTLAVAGVVLAQAGMVIAPLYLSRFIDTLSHTGAASDAVVRGLMWTLAFFASAVLVAWVGRRMQSFASQRLESQVMADLGNEAFSGLMHQDYDFFTSNFTGTLTRRVTRYSRAYEQVVDSVIQNFLPTVLFAAGSIAVLF